MTLIDLVGRQFGRLTVLSKFHKQNLSGTDEIFWVCKCSCEDGTEVAVRGISLRNNETRSCGCLRLESVRKSRKQKLTGLQFGRFTALEHVVKRAASGKQTHYYRCVCSCELKTEKLVQSSHLRGGITKSCGCLRREMLPSTKYLPGAHFVVKAYKRNATSRGLAWELTDEETESLISQKCFYCGSEPSHVITPPHRTVLVDFAYNGIDRLDSSKGYIPGNVVPCCTRCNYSKRNYSYSDFMRMVVDIYNYRGKEFLEMCRAVAANHPAKSAELST